MNVETRTSSPVRLVPQVLYALTMLLAFMLPFEIIRQTLALTFLEITNLELLVYVTMVVFTLHVLTPPGRARARRLIDDGRPLLLPALGFIGISLLSAAVAPSYRLEALKFVARLIMGCYSMMLIAYVATTRARLFTLVWALLLGAGVSALLGLGEVAQWAALDPLFPLFKAAPSRVGGTLRLSASFQYTTIASMFFELVVPLGLILTTAARTRRRRLLALMITLLCIVAVVLTLTRTGIVTLLLVFGGLVVVAWLMPFARPLARPTIVAGIVLLATIGGLMLQTTTFRTRLTTENDLSWYGATYSAPSTLTFDSTRPVSTTVRVRNTGDATWQAAGTYPFALGYYWRTSDGQRLDLPHTIVALPKDVPPDESIELTVHVPPPRLPAGEYRLTWGMLQQDILWFRHRGVPEAHTTVQLTPAATHSSSPSAIRTRPDEEPAQPPTIERLTLWRAAFRMWRERPLLGVGPDNFRHLYGRYLGLDEWDEGLHANNMYVEILTDVGILGAIVFAWFMLTVVVRTLLLLHTARTAPEAVWTAGLGGAFAAFLIHGLLDYFLEFASIYLLFWMILGLLIAVPRIFRLH